MKKYVAFLRGINISGKNKISMKELKAAFENVGFSDIATFLNSGNVVFCADEAEDEKILRTKIEAMIKEQFSLEIAVFVIDFSYLKQLLESAPSWWGTGEKTKYDNLIFILSDDSAEEICALLGKPSENLEMSKIEDNAIFWTFEREKYQKCAWWKKSASKGIAEKLTIRTAGTIKKILS